MNILKFIRPEKPLKELKWYDIAIVTAIMFGQFIVWSTELFLASLQPVAQTVTTATETATNTATADYLISPCLGLLASPEFRF